MSVTTGLECLVVEVGGLLGRREIFATREQSLRSIHAPRGRDCDANRRWLVRGAVHRRVLLRRVRVFGRSGDRYEGRHERSCNQATP